MSDDAKPSSPSNPGDEAPTNPTGEREAAEARNATTQPAPAPPNEPPVVWPRDMSAVAPEPPVWGSDPKGGNRG